MAKAKQPTRRDGAPRAESTAATSSAAAYDELLRWLSPAVICLTALVMLCWTWESWADIVVDFGRELYLPWRLTEGEVLYRDLAHFNGPLSPYLNSLWFRIFGVGLRTLALVNFALLLLILTLLHHLLRQIGSRAAALIGCLFFLAVFAFSALGYNFNYMCPYSHEMTHGLLASLAAVFFVFRYARSGRWVDVAASGFCVGLVLLTKPEFFLAAWPATMLGIALASRSHHKTGAGVIVVGSAYFSATLVAPAVSLALLSLAMPLSDAASGTLGALRWLLDAQVTMSPFYQRMRGTHHPGITAQRTAAFLVGYFLLLGIPAFLGGRWRARPHRPLPVQCSSWPCWPAVCSVLALCRDRLAQRVPDGGGPVALAGAVCGAERTCRVGGTIPSANLAGGTHRARRPADASVVFTASDGKSRVQSARR